MPAAIKTTNNRNPKSHPPLSLAAHAGFRLEPVEDGHAGGDAVFDLLVDEGALVGHDAIDQFDAAVHGAGVHDEDAFVADVAEALTGDAVEGVIFAEAGESELPGNLRPSIQTANK